MGRDSAHQETGFVKHWMKGRERKNGCESSLGHVEAEMVRHFERFDADFQVRSYTFILLLKECLIGLGLVGSYSRLINNLPVDGKSHEKLPSGASF